MTPLQHFRCRAWAARRPDFSPYRKPSPAQLAECRRAELREARRWRVLRIAGTFDTSVCQHARYQALLAAYSLRGLGL